MSSDKVSLHLEIQLFIPVKLDASGQAIVGTTRSVIKHSNAEARRWDPPYPREC